MQATIKTVRAATAFSRGSSRRFSVSVRAAEGHINPSIKKDVDKVCHQIAVIAGVEREGPQCRCQCTL